MIVVKDAKIAESKKLAATVGFFDGVHLGHRFLVKELKQIACQEGLRSAVITFPEHPRAVLQSDYQPKLLNTFDEKLSCLASTGVDACVVLDFTPQLACLTAQEFILDVLAARLHVKTLLVGYDHRFGHNRAEGFEQYVTYGAACGMKVIQASRFTEGDVAVSSSEIRRLLSECRVEEAARLLTYHYQLSGKVVTGYQVGRKLGFPTANIRVGDASKMIPGIGVYAVWVELAGKRYKGMLYIGSRPTLAEGNQISLEVNILNFSGDIYNKELTVSFVHYIRGDIKFGSLDELAEQLRQDREMVEKVLTE